MCQQKIHLLKVQAKRRRELLTALSLQYHVGVDIHVPGVRGQFPHHFCLRHYSRETIQ